MKKEKPPLTNEILSNKYPNQFFLVNKAIKRAEHIVMFEQTHGAEELTNPVAQVLHEMSVSKESQSFAGIEDELDEPEISEPTAEVLVV